MTSTKTSSGRALSSSSGRCFYLRVSAYQYRSLVLLYLLGAMIVILLCPTDVAFISSEALTGILWLFGLCWTCVLFWQWAALRHWQHSITLLARQKNDSQPRFLLDGIEMQCHKTSRVLPWCSLLYYQQYDLPQGERMGSGRKKVLLVFADMLSEDDYRYLCRWLLDSAR